METEAEVDEFVCLTFGTPHDVGGFQISVCEATAVKLMQTSEYKYHNNIQSQESYCAVCTIYIYR